MRAKPVYIFLVDDDEDDYVLIRDLLSESQGTKFELTWVPTYDAALEAIQQQSYDVYLLDYRLGDRTGLELLREAIILGCKAPMVLLTGQGDYEIDVEAMKAGAADYLDKSLISAPLLERSIRYAIERTQAEQKIREQAALLDIATDAILVREYHTNRILFWNKGAERLYGWKAEDVLFQNADDLLYNNLTPLEKVRQVLANSPEWQGELSQITKTGKEIIVESRWTLVFDDSKQPKSILVVNTDITEKKQLETQFLRTQRLESIGTLAGGVAHDLNNILSPILMTVQLLKMKLPDDQSQRWLNTLETSAKRGADLVKQVLSFSRGLKGEHTVLQVGHLVSELKHIIQETFPKSIDIVTNLSTRELWPVVGDATQLQQVLMNLCVNARDAMPEGGTLTISAENLVLNEEQARKHVEAQEGSYIRIGVADTGTGIPAEVLDRIFDPFFTTKEVGKGTGLGLSTVLGIIKSHHGFIKVDSHSHQGTSFQVYLPAADSQATLPIPSQISQALPHGKGELILVVDDELTIREATKNSLNVYGYNVLLASNGIEAISLYTQRQQDIKLVLLDIMMPLLDGFKAIRALQQINPEIKIIAVSGLATNRQIIETLGSSVKSFLPKPYTTQELLQTLYAVLEKD